MRYRLGLDIGITSIGWSVIHLDVNDEPTRIEDLGVRIFDRAENPKNGESLALPRRTARGARRRLRRRKHRLERIKRLFVRENLLTKDELSSLYYGVIEKDVWQLRYEVLERKLTNQEFAKVLLHLAKRRGFKSNRKSEAKDTETGKVLKATEENKNRLIEKRYRTVGEMFYIDPEFKEFKRNKTNDYKHTITRILLEDEIKIIFNMQREFGNSSISKQLEEHYIKIFTDQRPFADAKQIEQMIGYCTFEKEEKRAPKATYTFEKFMLLQKVNNIRINESGKYRELTAEERQLVVDLAYRNLSVKYKQIRKALDLEDSARFKSLTYGTKSADEVEKAEFIKLPAYHQIKKILKENSYNNDDLSQQELDFIGAAFTLYKDDKTISNYLKEIGIKDDVIEALLLLPLSMSKVGNLSIKAMKNILPYLEDGLSYDKAVELAGYNFNAISGNERKISLDPINQNEIANPVVLRALSQSRKVINAIIRKYGSPVTIHIELARDMYHDFSERQEMIRKMNENRSINEKAVSEIKNKNQLVYLTGIDVVKQKLWTQQNGYCIYSKKYINPSRLLEPGYVDVDHIIPYSRSFDDSYNNKVLVLTEENRQKGNRTPYEYFGYNTTSWHEFEEYIRTMNLPFKKQNNLLKKHFNRDDEREFKARNLNDTRYIARYLKNLLEQNLIFAKSDQKQKVYTVNGPVTAFIRKRWGLTKIREENDRHHALDATVVALTSRSMINKIISFIKNDEIKYMRDFVSKQETVDPFTGEVITDEEFTFNISEHFPLPWKNFREELEIRLNSTDPKKEVIEAKFSNYDIDDLNNVKPLFISRSPRRKITGPAHQETIRGYFYNDNKELFTVKKEKLINIKLKNGEFDMIGRDDDPLTYNLIRERLLTYDNDPKKAFAKKLYKLKKDGSNGPEIKSVKIYEKSNSGVKVNNGKGIANNAKMVRVDVFEKSGKYYLVPVYVSDIVKDELPDLAIKANSSKSEWTKMDETFKFKFSLYPNDLVRIEYNSFKKYKNKKNNEEVEMKELFGYYTSTHSGTSLMILNAHDNSWLIEGVGVKSGITAFEKYVIDPLGNYSLVKEEKRNGLAKHSYYQS